MRSEFERFIEKVNKEENGCWNWLGTTYRGGYGHFRRKINGKWVMYKAHRYSCEITKGPCPEGMFVCHTCDNPGCVNPDHLYFGTPTDNHWDMRERERWKLIRNPKHNLLSLETAKEIRMYKFTNPSSKLKDIATIFKTSIHQVSRILSNKIWQEV